MRFLNQPHEQTIAISKPPLLTLLTNAGNSDVPSEPVSWYIPSSEGLFKNDESLVDILSCKTVMLDDQGDLTITADRGFPQVSLYHSSHVAFRTDRSA